ncbi:1,2-phenylacetyl-CoA epoxidase subunit PaaD [Streptomyces sp. SBT349]|uniref:1,2-phenylacetyl-CoA epoxidase subunit PaaD n=1 Tax=Streptomyces sp. SBT349 TaxID=1580539 RepID=UPI00066C8BDC|nr:1,2-phenylacetyl-CoA epoxidase subunit PaaD [Streptomyces sp. SBT349]
MSRDGRAAPPRPPQPLPLGVLREVVGGVEDPELPVVTLADLGVVRRVARAADGRVEVELTPTYVGCPAVEVMREDIRRALAARGVTDVTVRTVLAPPWSTDDITEAGRAKLAEAGIAPPRPSGPAGAAPGPVLVPLTRPVPCPRCGSADTALLSRFSGTACMALRRCAACREPFHHVKER